MRVRTSETTLISVSFTIHYEWLKIFAVSFPCENALFPV